MMTEIKFKDDEEAFRALDEHGFSSDYVFMSGKNPRICAPAFRLEYLLDRGFYPKGTKARFLNKNGYDSERERAAGIFNTETEYTVKFCRVGSSSSTYEFEEVDGQFNTVMFEKVS